MAMCLYFLVLLVSFASILANDTTTETPACTCSKDSPRTKVFTVVEQKKNWLGAMIHCLRKGHELASIDHNADFESVTNVLNKLNTRLEAWVSGIDYGVEGEFIWTSTGKSIPYSDMWAPGHPDHYYDYRSNNEEHCVKMESYNNNEYRFYNENCTGPRYFICQNFV